MWQYIRSFNRFYQDVIIHTATLCVWYAGMHYSFLLMITFRPVLYLPPPTVFPCWHGLMLSRQSWWIHWHPPHVEPGFHICAFDFLLFFSLRGLCVWCLQSTRGLLSVQALQKPSFKSILCFVVAFNVTENVWFYNTCTYGVSHVAGIIAQLVQMLTENQSADSDSVCLVLFHTGYYFWGTHYLLFCWGFA